MYDECFKNISCRFYAVSMNIKLWQNILESNEIHLLEKYF